MMKHKAALAVLAFLIIGRWAGAQQFGPSTPLVSDAQVLNSGITVFAFDFTDFMNGTTTTVNGIDFSGAADFSNFTVSDFRGYGSADSPVSTMSTAFGNILSYASLSGKGAGTLNLNGLTSGQTYQLQLFAGWVGDSSSETITQGASSGDLAFGGGGSGAYSIIDTFVAGSGSEDVYFASDDGGMTALTGLNLREEITVVPEPSAGMLLGMGVLLMLGLVRCCRVQSRVGC